MDNSLGIGDLVAILTAGGVTIYVLGLIGLAIPIRREFTQDLSTAWYAVALIPKTVVAGQGARIWLQWPVVFILLLLSATALAATYPIVASQVMLLTALGAMVLAGVKLSELPSAVRVFGIVMGVAGSIVVLLGAFEVSNLRLSEFLDLIIPLLGGPTDSFESLESPLALPDLLGDERLSFSGFLLLVLGAFLLGVPLAIAETHPLPEVKITKRDEGEEVPDPPKRYLVAHSDGYWHLFDENRDLLSIPDDQVSSVRVPRKTDTPPADEPIHARLLRFLRRRTK